LRRSSKGAFQSENAADETGRLPVGLELAVASGRLHHCFVNVELRSTGMLACDEEKLDADPKSAIFSLASRALSEGRFAVVTNVGAGCGGRFGVARRAALTRTAKPCGPDAPTLASSLRMMIRRRRWQKSPVTGESAEETVKTIARGKPDVTGEPVATTRVLSTIAHGAAGAPSTRLSLRPLNPRGQRSLYDSGEITPREREAVSGRRHCEERLRRRNPWLLVCGSTDCFAGARNDDRRAV
jgi:hypothetical protein